MYETRKQVIEDSADESYANDGRLDRTNYLKVRGRIEWKCREPGAELPGGYRYEMYDSKKLPMICIERLNRIKQYVGVNPIEEFP